MRALQKRQCPAVTGHVSHSQPLSPRGSITSTRPIDRLLPLLRDVHKVSCAGWRATCPNSHAGKGGLSIAEAEDGRLLVHCFKSCDASDVLRAVGLELADLYPTPVRDPSPETRRAAHEAFQRAGWTAALSVLEREATVVLSAAFYARRGEALNDVDRARLDLAFARITSAREVLNGR